MSSPLGLMAPTIIDSDAVQGETFLPGQIFILGGFALRANSLGHLEQIELVYILFSLRWNVEFILQSRTISFGRTVGL